MRYARPRRHRAHQLRCMISRFPRTWLTTFAAKCRRALLGTTRTH
jgi:hypothetical protein